MKAELSYRLVGIRADGRREVLCTGIATKERADKVALDLIRVNVGVTAFASIVAELDGSVPPPAVPAVTVSLLGF